MGLTFNGTEIGSDIKINGNEVQNLKMGSSDVWSGREKLPSLPCNYVKKIIFSYHQTYQQKPGGVYIIGGSSSSDCKNVYEVLTVDQKVTGYRLCYTAPYNILDGCEDKNDSEYGGYLRLIYDSTEEFYIVSSQTYEEYTRSNRVKVKNGTNSSKDDSGTRHLLISSNQTFNQKGFTVGGTDGQILFYFGTPSLSASYTYESYYSIYKAVVDLNMRCTFYGKKSRSDSSFGYLSDTDAAPSSAKTGMGLSLLNGSTINELNGVIPSFDNRFSSKTDAKSKANEIVKKLKIEIEDVSFANDDYEYFNIFFFIKYKLTNTETGSYKNVFSPVYRICNLEYDSYINGSYELQLKPYVAKIFGNQMSTYDVSDRNIVSRLFVDYNNYKNYIRKTTNLYGDTIYGYTFSDNKYHHGITWFKGYGLYENGFVEMPDNLNKNLDFISSTPIRTGDELCYITTSGQIVQYNPVLNKFWIR